MRYFLEEGAYAPERAHKTDAGLDLRARERVVLRAHESVAINTGVHVQLPEGTYGKMESKSGLMMKEDIVCPGGVIDCGYTGPLVVKLENHGPKDHVFEAGDKIVQMVVQKYCDDLSLDSVPELAFLGETERGEKGFGSTGR